MLTEDKIILMLPCDDDIAMVEEVRLPSSPGLMKRTIRYKNGLVAELIKDFDNVVFFVRLHADLQPFLINNNQILKLF